MDWWTRNSNNEARPTRGDARPSVTEICESLLIGEYLRLNDIAWLKREYRVSAIQNLQDDVDLRINGLDIEALRRTCDQNGIKLVRTPIQDGSADDMAGRLSAALADLAALIQAGERVYVHCNAGLNRAPTLAIAYMRAYCGMSLNEAMAHVKQRRACGPFMTVLEGYFGPRDFKPEPNG
ncbi:MAG: dual specificity protein phosphatase family protein [Candidatus Binataceae bacterium]